MSESAARIAELRKLMKDRGIDAYMIPTADCHHSEYVNDHFKSREYMTGFTGSAGTAVIAQDDAGLWTDGRYFIQANIELEGSGVRFMKMRVEGTPSISEWITGKVPAGGTVGVDGRTLSMQWALPSVAASNTVRVSPGQSAVIVSPPTTSGCVWKLIMHIALPPSRSMRSTWTS